MGLIETQEHGLSGFGHELVKSKNNGSGVGVEDEGLGISMSMGMNQKGSLGLRSSCDVGAESEGVMLSFSSPKQGVSFLGSKESSGNRCVQEMLPASLSCFDNQYSTNSTKNTGYVNGSMNWSFHGIKGPFTPAQWIELEHQAFIYKYLVANVPVPTNLLIPLQKALASSAFCRFPGSSLPSHPYGWGPFHLGFSGSSDPEPGRCRRTDGKKWRCSRDAVPDKKYCERHINRGRHRSRKPVEGQTGHATSGPANTKVVPTPPSLSPLVSGGGCGSSVLPNAQRSWHQQSNTIMDYTVAPLHVHSLNHSMNDFPKGQSDHSSLAWPEELRSDWTQLSMSIPIPLGISSSSSSLYQQSTSMSSLRFSRDLETKQNSWVPISSRESMGGPLAEALNNTGSSGEAYKSTPAFNFLGEGWDGSSRTGSSPTDVLRNAPFASFSNSSSCNSPTTDKKTH
ncbi:hypothetical protein Droror1_Dr00009213 [Drosera rotundifolia]